MRWLVPLAASLSLVACSGAADWGDGKQSTIRPETDSARVVQDVYSLVTWIDIGIFIVVAALLLFAIIRYRARPGQEEQIPAQVHGNAMLEVVWTIIPAVLLIFIAVPTWSAIFRAHEPPAENAFTVQAVGHQWWWEFRYEEQGFVTANEMVIPVGRPVIVDTGSVDVIHAFWVPRLSGKIDSVPGRTNTLWFTPEQTGTYYGQCAEFCGTSHANMRFQVHVVTQEEFDAWAARQQQPPVPQSDDAREGQQLFVTKTCVACHAISGNPVAVGVLGPNLTNLPERKTLGSGIIENTPEELVRWIRETQSIKPGALMGVATADGYQPIDMTDAEARKLAAYLLSPPGEAPAAATDSGAAAAMAPAGGKSAEQIIAEKACIGCHVIPGVPGAVGTVGPSLAGLMSRDKIAAGLLDNTEENLRKWLADPRAIKANTLMVTPPLSPEEVDTLVEFLMDLK